MSRKEATNLAAQHWEWLSKMLKATSESGKNIKMIGIYYRAAFVHGYKHGEEKTGDSGDAETKEGCGESVWGVEK